MGVFGDRFLFWYYIFPGSMLYLFHFCCSRNSWTRSSIYVELLRSLTGLGSLRFLGITISSQQGKWRGVLERSTNSKYIIFYAFSICQFCASSFTCFFCIKALIGMLWNCSIECWLLIHLRYLFVWHDYPLFLSHSLSLFACKVMVDFTIRIIISSYLSEILPIILGLNPWPLSMMLRKVH